MAVDQKTDLQKMKAISTRDYFKQQLDNRIKDGIQRELDKGEQYYSQQIKGYEDIDLEEIKMEDYLEKEGVVIEKLMKQREQRELEEELERVRKKNRR